MKIHALDIGSKSIKSVEFEVRFGRLELSNYTIYPVAEISNAPSTEKKEREILTTGQKITLRRIVTDKRTTFEKTIVNIPNSWTTTRIFHLPSKDRKTIQNSLNFELEDDIPFSLEDVLYDFAMIRTDGSSTNVFATVALRSDVSLFLSELQMLGVDPDAITTEAWAFSQSLKRAIPPKFENKPICLINIGASQTNFHIYLGSNPVLSHTSSCAGNMITQGIASNYHISFEEAEKAKVDGAFLITHSHLDSPVEITEEQKQFSSVIADAIAPLIRELKQALIACKSQNQQEIRALFITGGSSQIPNLALYLEEALKIPVFHYSYISQIIGQSMQLSESTEAQLSTAVGLGVASIKPDRNSNINLRTNEYAKRSALGMMSFQTAKKTLGYAVAALAFIFLNLFAQHQILSSKLSNSDEIVERAIKSVLGAATPSVLRTYQSSPTTLKAAVEKELAKYKESYVVNVKPQTSGLDLLNKISAGMPRTMVLDVNLFQMRDGKLRLVGTVDQMSQLSSIEKALNDTKLLSEVAKTRSDEDPKKKLINFEFSAKVAEASNVGNR